jgi:prepilin peptidase CpaA
MSAYLPILGTLLAIAAAADVGQRRVPNLVVALLAAAGLGVQCATGGAAAAGSGLLAGLVVIAVLAFPWVRGLVGGGDVKLAAAAATWLGIGAVVPFLLLAGAAGLPVALAARLSHRLALRRLARAGVGDAAVARETVPVAVAVALGALVVAWGRP